VTGYLLPIARGLRSFPFFAIVIVTLYQFYSTVSMFRRVTGNVTRAFDFVSGFV
jgi:hypothetical protein